MTRSVLRRAREVRRGREWPAIACLTGRSPRGVRSATGFDTGGLDVPSDISANHLGGRSVSIGGEGIGRGDQYTLAGRPEEVT